MTPSGSISILMPCAQRGDRHLRPSWEGDKLMLQVWSFFFKGVCVAELLGSGFGGLALSSFAQELLRVCRNDARPRKGNVCGAQRGTKMSYGVWNRDVWPLREATC